jgi:parvulin-like peptidyl-prolyl isomerase
LNPATDLVKKRFKYLPQILVFILIIAAGCLWVWRVCDGDWVVQVNGYKVSEKDFEQETARLQATRESQGVSFEGDEGEKQLNELRQTALGQLEDRALVYQAAKQLGLKVEKAKVEEQIVKYQQQAGGADNFKNLLKGQGMTEEEYKAKLEEDMLIQQLVERATGNVMVGDKEMRESYEELKGFLVFPERVKVGHILVKTEEEAQEIIAELKNGADFQELAVKKSQDASVAQNKGIIDNVSKDSSFAEEFKEEAFRLAPGEFSQKPVKTEFGYHVLRCFEKKEAGQASYEEVKDWLQQQLLYQKKQERFSNYIAELRQAGRIMYHPKKHLLPV